MRVVVYAEDLSGRRDDGYYTKRSIAAALDIFFSAGSSPNFTSSEGEDELTRADAEAMFDQDKRVTFYNADGEKVVISLDPCAST